jgi:hypothetical protein
MTLLVAALSHACVGSSTARGYALYSGTRSADEVAMLSGYVGFVDGRDVTKHGLSFELLPGCHVVQTPDTWGESSQDTPLVATTGHLAFVVWMRPGHHYSVTVKEEGAGTPVTRVQVAVLETDAKGNRVRSLSPTTSEKELRDCWQQR